MMEGFLIWLILPITQKITMLLKIFWRWITGKQAGW
jgi:hypothetical protein